MNTQQPNRPVITPTMREQAQKQPNTWLYVVDPIFTDPNAEVPPWGFIGGYRVDEQGEITDDFSPNPNYRPSPVALRLPAPTNDVERALQLTTTGYAQGHSLLTAMLDAELILFAQPQGSGLFTMEHESGRRQLQVFTSETFLPPNWTTWQRMTGRQLATHNLTGIDVQVNPTSPVKARLPVEDLAKAAVPPKAPGVPINSPANGMPVQAPAGAAPQPGEQAPKPTGGPTAQPPGDPLETGFGRRFLGSMLAGAIGDALGAPVEFYPVDQIRSRFGAMGVTEYDRAGEHPGEFTDDTQMVLFTLEGLIRGHFAARTAGADSPLSAIQLAYQRWLHTQGYAWMRAAGPFTMSHPKPNGWLIEQRDLFAVRSPNSSCITALREFAAVGAPGTFERPINDSQDCGGVVRAAPVALWSDDPEQVFELAAATAALTCSQPNGYLPAGALAVVVHRLLREETLEDAVRQARELLVQYQGHEDTERALQAAEELAEQGKPSPEQLKDTLGGGWAGHEALAIAVCAALSTDSIAAALMVSVNHSGDSDSTAAICGNIVGARYGAPALPGVWLRDLKQREIVEALAKDALLEFGPNPPSGDAWTSRYPAAKDISELVFTSALQLTGAEPVAKPSKAAPVADDAPAEAVEPEAEPDAPAVSIETADQQEAEAVEAVDEPWLERYPIGEAAPAVPPQEDVVTPAAEVPERPRYAAGTPESETAQPGEGPVEDDPAPETPDQEAPAQEAAAAEVPVADAPAAETPAAEPPASETPVAEAAVVEAPAAETAVTEAPAEAGDEADEGLSEEELQLLSVWREFRDNGDGNSADLTQGLQKLLVEAFGPERAAQLIGEAAAGAEAGAELAAETRVQLSRRERLEGCVLGAAVGDALGAPWMFSDLRTILGVNPEGVRELAEAFGRRGAATAYSQQAAFVLYGLIGGTIRSTLRGVPAFRPGLVRTVLQQWLLTQGARVDVNLPAGTLAENETLRVQRFPDEASLTSLAQWNDRREPPTPGNPPNAARTPAATVRGAVVGFEVRTVQDSIALGIEIAAVTHGHPDGYLPAGALSGLVSALQEGHTLAEAVHAVLAELDQMEGAETTALGLRSAIEIAANGPVSPAGLETLGLGWQAPEALAIAVAAALAHPNSFADAVSLAATHAGNSAATASICGSLLGTARGAGPIPAEWTTGLELRPVLDQLLEDAHRAGTEIDTHEPVPGWAQRYPG
ncbi:type VII secretion system-associated protein [Saccharopolyspora pogona]|uniref:type VII secretion system-associated protein n=1 Tax=Saccharopolyspora pogona TaxID=333966 RepID=UPI001683FC4B|nr:type VII secretion system-associated protein [Saccharopolyspora pogona]